MNCLGHPDCSISRDYRRDFGRLRSEFLCVLHKKTAKDVAKEVWRERELCNCLKRHDGCLPFEVAI